MTWWKYRSIFDIKWQEPYGFTHSLSKLGEKSTRWWRRPLGGFVQSVLFLGLFLLIKPDSGKIKPVFPILLLLAFGLGYFITYVVSLAHYFSPREIGFGAKGIVSMLGQQTTVWPYEHIHEVRFESQTFGKRSYQLMVVRMKGGQQLVAGVHKKIKVQEVLDYLKDKGIEAAQTA